MAIADDFSVENDGTGDIRYTGDGSTTYTVLAFKNYLGALQDDAQAAGDDLADITTETIYERSTDEILTLNSPFNLDDTAVEHIYDGSVTQNIGDDEYSGLYVVGVVETGTEPMIVQDNEILPSYWGTGLNPDAAENVIMKIMVKTREGGADINNQKIRVLSREFLDTYAEFDVTLGTANSTAAIFTSDDLNNNTAHGDVEAWIGTITNTEGYQLIDIDGNGTGEEYYSKWDPDTQSLNDTYEFTKWYQKRSEIADENNAETGDDWPVDNATIVGIGTEFSARDNAQLLTEARFWLKIGAGTPTGNMYCELYDSDDVATAAPTGGVLATSEVLDTNRLTSSYIETIFRFTDGYSMVADQEYFIVIKHPDGAAGDYVEADGDSTTADDGNYASLTGTVWTGAAGDALRFEVKSSPAIHGMAGELFRGITTEVVYDGESGGPFTEDARLFWGTRIGYDGLSGVFEVGRYVKIGASGTPTVSKNGGKILFDDTVGDVLYVALEDITGAGSGLLAEDDKLTQIGGTAASADATAVITDDTKAGGEGTLLALDDNGSTGDLYLQITSGAAPVDDLRVSEATAKYALVNATINARTISPAFVGQSTGTNIIGAYGIGFEPTEVGSSDKFFDLSNTLRTPPNNVTFTVGGLVSGEDRVLVGPRSGSVLNKAQYALQTALAADDETDIVVSTAIQTETPSAGVGALNTRLRVELDTGVYRRVPYTSWSASTFTTSSLDWSDPLDALATNDVFVAYIDVLADAATEAFTAVHSSTRDILIRVRDGGATPIKTVESSAQFTGSATTVTINRVDDY